MKFRWVFADELSVILMVSGKSFLWLSNPATPDIHKYLAGIVPGYEPFGLAKRANRRYSDARKQRVLSAKDTRARFA
jgi:hypothetical protein